MKLTFRRARSEPLDLLSRRLADAGIVTVRETGFEEPVLRVDLPGSDELTANGELTLALFVQDGFLVVACPGLDRISDDRRGRAARDWLLRLAFHDPALRSGVDPADGEVRISQSVPVELADRFDVVAAVGRVAAAAGAYHRHVLDVTLELFEGSTGQQLDA